MVRAVAGVVSVLPFFEGYGGREGEKQVALLCGESVEGLSSPRDGVYGVCCIGVCHCVFLLC